MKKKNRENRFQKKLSHKESNGEASEYAQEFLKTPEDGPLVTDDAYAELDALEYFNKRRLQKFRQRLLSSMSHYPDDLRKIEAGLSSYAHSAVIHTRELAVLVRSLSMTFENILLENYESSDDAIRQVIKASYFDTTDWTIEFDLKPEDLITPDGLRHYRSNADKITISAMNHWLSYMVKKEGENSLAQHYDELFIQKGVNHARYYQEVQLKADMLSAYTGLHHFPFFESDILSSYSISFDVAGKFMAGTINSKGQRRLMIDGHPEMIEGRILSSWMVSPSFIDGQFEILCLPNQFTLYVNWKNYDEIAAGFGLSRT